MPFPELQTLIIDDIGPMCRSVTKAPVSKLRPHCIAKPRSCSFNYLCWGFFSSYKTTATAKQSVQWRKQRMLLCMKWGQSDITQMAQWNTNCRAVPPMETPPLLQDETHTPRHSSTSHTFCCVLDKLTCASHNNPSRVICCFKIHYPAELEHFNYKNSCNFRDTNKIAHVTICYL